MHRADSEVPVMTAINVAQMGGSSIGGSDNEPS